MKIQDYEMKNVLITFSIGFFAGITPFAFTKVLPMILRPEEFVPMQSTHLWIMIAGMLVTGVIVGVIIALLYAGSSEQLTPKEVFLFALGIPAILITTVTNFATDVKARSEISAMQDAANAVISNPGALPKDIPESSFKAVSGLDPGKAGGLLTGTAHAADLGRPLIVAQTQKKSYLVIIGTYTSREEARSAFDGYVNRKFRTETYVPKQLELLEQAGSPPQFVIIYARFSTPSEASRASRYLMINDRDLQVSITKQSP